MVSLLTPLGQDSFSTLYQPNPYPSTGEQVVTNPQIANNTVTPPIDATITSQPYNFTLGTTAGANDPTAVADASNAVYPLDNGDPEYSPSEASIYQSLGDDASIDPADLDPSVFAAWSQAQQQIYLQSWGLTQAAIGANGGADALYAGTSSSGVYSTMSLTAWALEPLAAADAALTPNTTDPSTYIDGFASAQGVSTTTAQNDLSVSPMNLDPNVFDSWTPAAQSYYEQYWGLINNNSGVSGAIGVNINGGANAIVINNATSGPAVFLPLSTPISTWAMTFGAALNAQGQSTPTAITDPSPSDLDGYGGVAPADLNPTIFENWTSEQQAEYMNYNGLTTAVIGTDVSGATPITAVLSQSLPNTVYIVQNLQASDLAGMSSADVALVASTAAWSEPGGVGEQLGFLTQDSSTGQTPMQVAQGGITADINQIEGSAPNAVTVTTATGQNVTVYGMPTADRQVFIDELNLLSQQVTASGVVNETQISSDASAIMQRFTQAAIYWSQYYPSTFPLPNGGVSGAVGTDDNAGIQETYQTLIAQEQNILQAAQDAENLSSPTSTDSAALDAPTTAMIALGASMSSQEAQIEIGTTQLQQVQTFLQNLGALQNLVNTTVNSLDGNTTIDLALGGNYGGTITPSTDLTPSQLAVADMFSSNIAGANPILTQYGISLPSMTLIRSDGSMPGYTSSQWTTYGQSLSNVVTELQQQAQTLTTDLNQETQQMNNTFTEMSGIAGQMGTVINTIGTEMD